MRARRRPRRRWCLGNPCSLPTSGAGVEPYWGWPKLKHLSRRCNIRLKSVNGGRYAVRQPSWAAVGDSDIREATPKDDGGERGLAEEHPELVDPPPTWAQQVSSAFQTHNVHGAIESFANNISNDTIANVRTAAVLLQKGSTRKVLTLEELRVVRDDLDALLQEVLAGSQPPEIRLYICRSLRKIIAAIDEYQLTDAAPIFEGIEQEFGHAGVDPAYRSFLTDTELGARVLSALSAAGNLMTVAVGMPQLAHFATLLLKAPA